MEAAHMETEPKQEVWAHKNRVDTDGETKKWFTQEEPPGQGSLAQT